jgi:hypothetical protein
MCSKSISIFLRLVLVSHAIETAFSFVKKMELKQLDIHSIAEINKYADDEKNREEYTVVTVNSVQKGFEMFSCFTKMKLLLSGHKYIDWTKDCIEIINLLIKKATVQKIEYDKSTLNVIRKILLDKNMVIVKNVLNQSLGSNKDAEMVDDCFQILHELKLGFFFLID